MTRLLRIVTKGRWYQVPLPGQPPRVQGDCFTDLRTTNNALSVWEIADQDPGLDQVVAAIAAVRQKVDAFDFATVDKQHVERSGLKLVLSSGVSADPRISGSSHYDVVDLDAGGLAQLAFLFLVGGAVDRYHRKRVEGLIRDGIAAGRLSRAMVTPKILSEIEAATTGGVVSKGSTGA